MRKRFKLPSPAMTVACISLAVALSGAGYAAVALPKNSVGTKQLRNNAVKSNKIAPDQVTGADVNEATLGTVPSAANAAGIADNTVNGAKVVDNSLGGADVNEGNLAQVPQAGNADTVDNLHAHVYSFVEAPGTSPENILSVGGLTLTANCDLIADISLTATTSTDGALMHVSTSAGSTFDDVFDSGDPPVNLLPVSDTAVQGTFTYSRPSTGLLNPGATVTGTYTANEGAFGTSCVVRGTAMSSTPSIFIIF